MRRGRDARSADRPHVPTPAGRSRRLRSYGDAAPERFAALDDALFAAHFVEGRDLGDPATVDRLATEAGAPLDELSTLRADGFGSVALDESMERARDAGVAATPAWLLEGGLLIPGVQPVETIERWIGRVQARAADRGEAPPTAPG